MDATQNTQAGKNQQQVEPRAPTEAEVSRFRLAVEEYRKGKWRTIDAIFGDTEPPEEKPE